MFGLSGKVSWSVGSCHDDRWLPINEKFEAKDEESAIDKARAIINKLHHEYAHNTDYGLYAELWVIKHNGTKRKIWKVNFQDEQSACPAIPAQSARPYIPAQLIERTPKKKKRR